MMFSCRSEPSSIPSFPLNMREPVCVCVCVSVCVSVCLWAVAALESQDVVPVRVRTRTSGRFWKRSEDQQMFIISAFGDHMTLSLSPDRGFMAPSFTVERVRSGAPPVTDPHGHGHELRNCFYSGTVDQDPDSVVAVSLCSGMFGSFILEGKEFLIRPKAPGSAVEQPHVLVRRNHTVPLRFDHPQVARPALEPRVMDNFTHGHRDARTRRRRFVSAARFIETLVVVDTTMAHYYGDEIQHYILTLMSMAAQIYKHPSIKNSVNLVVVKMLVVEDVDVGPQVSSNGGITLRNFCSWQQRFNPPSQRHPEHYDTAVLFTRVDVCGHKTCDTLGVAEDGTMCDPTRSCSVVEDSGLQAAFTTAHELGHVLSMPHDDSKTCERFGDQGPQHLMAPYMVNLNQTAPWSPCSALYITEFFNNGHGDCLLDVPESSMSLPRELPGTRYSLDQQCQQVFGEDFIHCPNTSDTDVCSQLWCQEEGTPQCSTKNGTLPWADGSPCGTNRTCLHGACWTTHNNTQPVAAVDGGWGSWGPWQQCSKTCGGGVALSYRECSDPVPQNGGKYCEGQRVQYQSCHIQPCQSQGKSFREEQCEKYNSPVYVDHRGDMKQWIPKYSGVSPRDRCKLFCRARGSSEFKVFQSKVTDGTTCGSDTSSVCVQGQCVKAGCDQIIGSNKKMDKCGVCEGSGTSCRKITGSFTKASFGYSDIVTVPVGATNIDVKQRSHKNGVKHDGNYLAIKREGGGYVLNGNYSVSMVELDVPVLGAVLRYSGSGNSLERIQSFRRLEEAITIQLLVTGGETNPPKVKYSFFIPRDVVFSKSKEKKGFLPSLHVIQPFGVPEWVLGEWSECSKSCGSGWSRRSVACRDSKGFSSSLCDEALKPADIRPCGDLPCPIWQMGPWSACSRTCGQGERRRSVFCIDYTGKTVESHKCDPNKVPDPVSADCFNQDCSS